MALDFLIKSPTYVKNTPKDILRRRATVCRYLNKNYRVTRNKNRQIFRQIQKDLKREGLQISESTYRRDKQVYRGLFQYLNSIDKDERQDIRKKRSLNKIVKYLIRDAIFGWENIFPPEGQMEPVQLKLRRILPIQLKL